MTEENDKITMSRIAFERMQAKDERNDRWDGICYEPLAEEMDMSVRQIKTIVAKAEARLFKHL